MTTPIQKPYFSSSKPKLTAKNSTASSSISPYFTAKQMATIYGFPAPNTSISNVVGVMSFGGGLYGSIDANGFLTKGDVQKYWAYEGTPASQMPKVIVRPMRGATNDLNDYSSTTENTLDVSVVGSCCPNPKLTIILFIFTQNYTLTQAFQAIINGITVAGIKYTPSVISVSWGCPEIFYLTNGVDRTGDLTGVNNLLATATKNGINICVASGDNGSTDRNGTTQLSVDFPSSCPYVTAVGGTTLVCPTGIYDSSTRETVWNDGIVSGTFWATGGGMSAYYAKPNYQQSVDASISTYRTVPDIALNSDPDTGMVMYQNGILQVGIGGTSMAAPMFAGYLAAINAKTFVNPLLYDANRATCFNDIITGYNYDITSSTAIKSYVSSVGYDLCSGLGSIRGDALRPLLAPAPAMATHISITNTTSSLNIYKGQTIQFSSLILPSTSVNKKVIWSSSNTAIARVNSATGLVKALKEGTVTIRVSTADGTNLTAFSTLTISTRPVLTSNISLTPKTVTLNLLTNKTTTFTPIISPANTTNKTVYWLSSNSEVINVDLNTGVVTAVGKGKAYIGAFAMDGSKRYIKTLVTVLATPPAARKMIKMKMIFH